MTRTVNKNSVAKVLLITRNFPPLRGGMERLNARLFQCLYNQEPASALVGPAGSARYVAEGTNVAELAAGPLPATLLSSVTRGIAMARRMNPSVVLAGSGLAAPAAIAAAHVSGAVPAVYLHGLDIIAPSRMYHLAWLPCIRRCKRVMVNSSNTRRLALEAGINEKSIRVVHPGTDLPSPDRLARARFRARHGLDDAVPVLLSVGRLTARKGLAEFVDRSLPLIHAANPDSRLVIIGDQATDALYRGRGAGIASVRAAAEARGIADVVHWLGPCSDSDLADAYWGADLHVFPVRDIPGDVEGFGMVAIEAAAHGLQTIAFDVGGVADAVVDGSNGSLIPADDYEAFAHAVIGAMAQDRTASSVVHTLAFAQRFSWGRFDREVIEALEQIA